MDEAQSKGRMLDAVENIALELERLRLLQEYELEAHIEGRPDPNVIEDDATDE